MQIVGQGSGRSLQMWHSCLCQMRLLEYPAKLYSVCKLESGTEPKLTLNVTFENHPIRTYCSAGRSS